MIEKKIKLSASKIKALQNCSWIYYCQYILKIPQNTNAGASRGLCAHLVLECLSNKRHNGHYEKAKNQIISDAVCRLIKKHAKKLSIDEENHIEMIHNMIITAVQYDFFSSGSEKSLVEHEFKIESDNYIINGFIDKIAFFTDKIKIIDYKSSKAKFSRSEMENNIQALMYSLACYKKYGKIPEVEFLFLRFPRNPVQFFNQCSEKQLKGFESFLEYLTKYLMKFDEKYAKSDMAFYSIEKKWLCGKTGNKVDGSPNFICQYRLPSEYYIMTDKNNEIVSSSFKKEDLKPKTNCKIKKISYKGCPAFNCQDFLD